MLPCQSTWATACLNPSNHFVEPHWAKTSQCQSKPSARWMACKPFLFSITKDQLKYYYSPVLKYVRLNCYFHRAIHERHKHYKCFRTVFQNAFRISWNIKTFLTCSATWQLKLLLLAEKGDKKKKDRRRKKMIYRENQQFFLNPTSRSLYFFMNQINQNYSLICTCLVA